jgi:hypothetical protein
MLSEGVLRTVIKFRKNSKGKMPYKKPYHFDEQR